MAEQKPTNRERLREITDSIERGIQELFESEKYRQYLSTMSRFHLYSVNNTMLIYVQKPDATLVAGFNKWQNQFERHVKKGERGIKIIAPTPFKKKTEEMKLDPDTKAPVLDRDGKAVMEEKEVEIPLFCPVTVFDVSQTEGKPLPQLASDLTGNVQQFDAFLEALRRTAPVPLRFEPMEDMDGYFSRDSQYIALRKGMSEVQTVSAAVHEIAHSILHNTEQTNEAAAAENEAAPQSKPKSRNTKEVEAESVSFAVCQYYGIQTGENSFGYIAEWSRGKELAELKASLDTINKTANQLITEIDRHFKQICTERGIEHTADEKPVPTDFDLAESPQDAQPTPQPRRYTVDETGETRRTWNGKLPENFASEDAAAFMAETAAVLGAHTEETLPAESVPPDVPMQTLDEYPMPDETLTVEDMEKIGHQDGELLPLSLDRAQELFAEDLTVYSMSKDGGAEMIFGTEDFAALPADMIYAISREDWEQTPAFDKAVRERMEHQPEREQAFLNHRADCFALYHLKQEPELRDYRWEGLEHLQENDMTVQRKNYELVYTAPLTAQGGIAAQLGAIYEQFNLHNPADYRHHSLSVSDIVAIRRDGALSCHYVDSAGFAELPDFIQSENYLKAAEMAAEDDYNMIDGIINNGPKQPTVAELEQQARNGQPISLMELAAASHREQADKKKSVVEQLQGQLKAAHKKAAPDRRKEREI